MTKDAIKDSVAATPFKAFSLRLTDGTLVPVPHPDYIFLTQGGRTAVVATGGEHFRILDLTLVTAIEFNPPSDKAA